MARGKERALHFGRIGLDWIGWRKVYFFLLFFSFSFPTLDYFYLIFTVDVTNDDGDDGRLLGSVISAGRGCGGNCTVLVGI